MKKDKISKEMDMELFHIEQDIKDLEEEMLDQGDEDTAKKLRKIADKVMALQND